jgi:hypothetical protein
VVPSTRQIEQQVAAVLQHDAGARVLGIQAARPGAWPERIRVGTRQFRLAWCESPLSAREALLDGDGSNEGLILLTAADDQSLGADVLARLARGQVFRLRSWELVRDLFQARDIDPRLGKLGWIADFLVEGAPASGYVPAPGGFLSADRAWQQVLSAALGIAEPRPDGLALVEWTLREDASARLQALAAPMRTDVAGWLAGVAGAAGHPVVACVVSGKGADVLPLGLLCDLLFREGSQADPNLAAAAARLERFTDGQRIEPLGGRRWGEAAVAALARLPDPARVRTLLARADTLLAELGLTAQAEASDVLQAGFDARLARYAEALAAAVPAPSAPRLTQAEAAAARVLAHGQAHHHPGRCARIGMSLRLLRWLASSERAPGDFPAAAKSYAEEGACVDWARMTLIGGDDLGPLSGAYAGLALAVRARRERLNRRFAELLLIWNGAWSLAGSPGTGSGLVPVEGVLGSVLAPLAALCPTLLLVADGMSLAIFRALAASLTALGWNEVAPGEGPPALVGVATLPTVTGSSRTSLLCGRLTQGSAAQEKSGFSTHPALLSVSRPTARPLLFHKAELADGSGLSDAVRAALRARDQRVVGVVYNAVDDHLSGSDQLHQTWSVTDLRLLGPLLHEARLAGRAVVITADHGHVLDGGTTLRSHEDGDRWRRGAGAAGADEILVSGGRVLAPGGPTAIILPWSEGVRYAGKKNGYHGGATPQEVLVPLVVLVPAAQEVPGWRLAPPVLPAWWEAAPSAGPVAQAEPLPIPSSKLRKATGPQGDLFLALATPPVDPGWVERLLTSPVYAEQKRLAARIAPADEDLRRFLLALDSRGGKLGKTALAQRLGMPMVRIGGFLSAVRRVLNVDRSAVVAIDEAAGEVEFNRELLDLQFHLGGTEAMAAWRPLTPNRSPDGRGL